MVGKQLNKKLDELEQWFKENPKLPQEIDRILLRRFLKSMYYEVEDAKRVIELNFSMRNSNPHIFIDRDPEDEEVKAIRNISELIPLPGVTPEGYKLLFFRLADRDPKKLNSLVECKTYFLLADCRFSDIDHEALPQKIKVINEDTNSEIENEMKLGAAEEDNSLDDDLISDGEVQICDIGGFTLSHMARMSLTILRMHMKFLQEAYPVRLRAMHIINCPSYINKMIAIVKPFIHEDVYKMMHFHSGSLDSLYEKVPRDMLPNEYGGKAGTIAELKNIWTEELKIKRAYLMDPKQWKVDQAPSSRRWYWF